MTTTVDMNDPHQRDYAACAQAKAAIKLHKAGIRANRNVTTGKWMEIARKLTGAPIAGRDYDGAIRALEKRMEVLLLYAQHGS